MLQFIIVALPGLASLAVCIRRGPQYAFLNVYLPSLVLFPDFCRWSMWGEPSFAETAILPIAIFLLLRPHQKFHWSIIDLLVISFAAMTAIAEGMNAGFKLGQNMLIGQLWSIVVPYYAMKQLIGGSAEFAVEFAKRLSVLLTFVAIISIYECRMSSDLFVRPFAGIFTPPGNTFVGRWGFKRVEGPYGHAIAFGTIMAIGYRMARWLEWSGKWPGRVRFVRMSKVRFCEFWVLVGSMMAISVGPWLSAAVGALFVAVCRARNRKRALGLLMLAAIVLGPPAYSRGDAYVSTDSAQEGLQQDSAYRRLLLPTYIPLVQERPAWGWGRNGFPVINGMTSIDNGYLLTALTSGVYALGLIGAIMLWCPICLCAYGLGLPAEDPAALTSFTLMGIFLIFIVSMGTVAILAGQCGRLFFLIAGWSVARLKSEAVEIAGAAVVVPQLRAEFAFQRVVA
jgi:hypothetical protein